VAIPALKTAEDIALDAISEQPAPIPAPPATPKSPPKAVPSGPPPVPSGPAPAGPVDLTPAPPSEVAAAPLGPRFRPTAKAAARSTESGGGGRFFYLLFALTLIPLAMSVLGAKDSVEDRLLRTLASQPDIGTKLGDDEAMSEDALFSLLPGGKIEGAHLSHHTWMHWLYALLAVALFGVLLLLLFPPGNATFMQVAIVAACTATVGILFLICVQWIAECTQGYMVYGRSILVLFFYILKFIGFSYRAALDPDMGFWVSLFGYMFGVGLCEEITKALPVIFRIRGEGSLDWRGACQWGLASGVGFGVAEGILYASSHYNGLATWATYLVRFVSCVALHATWTAAASIMVWRRREWLHSDSDWGDLLATLAWVLAVPIVLHAFYNTLLKEDMDVWALVVAAASFAWLVAITEWTRSQEVDFFASESRRLRRPGLA